MSKKIGVIIGSIRKESLNRKMAEVLISIAPDSIKPEIIEIRELTFYNQDLDDAGTPPIAWTTFRKQVKSCDGILFVTPEYNRSIPGVLKNAIDVGSRPYSDNAWAAKPGAVMSVSPGAIGGFGANHQLRQALVAVNIPTLPQPETYIGNAGKLFDEHGKITNEDTQKFLQKFMETYADWVMKNT